MSCKQCTGIEEMFDSEHAKGELSRYRKRGPRMTTRRLVRELISRGVTGSTVLEVGGGVGDAHMALLAAGAGSAVDVDASKAFLKAAEKEAARGGLGERVKHLHGDFVDLAPGIAPADIVVLDKVVCCYPDAESLLTLSAERAGRILGLVYPSDNWISRVINWAFNLWTGMEDFKTYVHRRKDVETFVASRGLKLTKRLLIGLWQVAIFSRPR